MRRGYVVWGSSTERNNNWAGRGGALDKDHNAVMHEMEKVGSENSFCLFKSIIIQGHLRAC